MSSSEISLNLRGTRLFSAWHLNLNYSSLDKESHHEVIEKCYWPLLSLAESSNCAQGIEISGSSLARISHLDPSWIEKLITLERSGSVEIIASGHQQIIGPLAPESVNRANFETGNSVLDNILGVVPRVAFVNEQCVSKGLLTLLEDMGFEAAIVEWENARISNPNWSESVGWYPQRFLNASGIRVIWNRSRWFQGLQRYAHNELELASLLHVYNEAQVAKDGAFCFYGGDAETFDFRAGRFSTESTQFFDEWGRVRDVLELTVRAGADWVKPSELISGKSPEVIDPFDIENQVLTKKQPKYNAVRWAAGGRANYELNNFAHMATKADGDLGVLPRTPLTEDTLSIWASDLRTHLTQKRWNEIIARYPQIIEFSSNNLRHEGSAHGFRTVGVESNLVTLEGEQLFLDLNLRKGITVEAARLNCECGEALIGRVPYGSLPPQVHSPDWYSGNFVHSPPGRSQDSDISSTPPQYEIDTSGLILRAQLETQNFLLTKRIDLLQGSASYRTSFEFDPTKEPAGALRVGFMALRPDAWAWKSTYFESHDGGLRKNVYPMKGSSFDHGSPVSHRVSASNLAGISEGLFSISDGRHRVTVELDDSSRGAALMLAFTCTPKISLLRTFFSIHESDDTSYGFSSGKFAFAYTTSLECLVRK